LLTSRNRNRAVSILSPHQHETLVHGENPAHAAQRHGSGVLAFGVNTFCDFRAERNIRRAISLDGSWKRRRR
jgi:hypothetical protein